jgi:hypothetical protein
MRRLAAQSSTIRFPMKRLIIVLLTGLSSGAIFSAETKDLYCEPDNPNYWVEFVRISPGTNTVLLKLRQYAPQKFPLVFTGPEQFGEPTYAFNEPLDGPGDQVFNVFKLFRVDKTWLLISAGLEPRGETTSLRAISKAEEFDCRRMAPDKATTSTSVEEPAAQNP